MSGFEDGASQASSRRSRASAVGADTANSSKQLNFSEPPATRFLTEKFPIFPLLTTYKQAHMQIVTLCSMLIFALQHWALVMNPHFSLEWGRTIGNVVVKVLYGTELAFYDPMEIPAVSSATVLIVFNYALLMATVALFGCIFFHLTRKEDKQEAKGVTAVIAHVLLEVLSTVLFIPFLQLCLSSLACNSQGNMWIFPSAPSAKCWHSSHIACFVPAVLCLLLLLPVTYLTKVCVYDYNALTDNFMARRYSVMEHMTFFHDVISIALFNVMTPYDAVTGYAMLVAIGAFILAAGYIFYLPYYSMRVNRFFVVVHTLEMLAAIFLAVARTDYWFLQSVLSATLLLGFGVALVVIAIIVTDIRVSPNYLFAIKRSAECIAVPAGESSVAGNNTNQLPSHNFEEMHTTNVDDSELAELAYPKGLTTTDVFSQYVGLNTQVLESLMRQSIHAYLDDFQSPKDSTRLMPVLDSYVDYVLCSKDVPLATGFLDLFSAQFGQTQLTPIMILFGANIYSRALVTFPDDPFVLQAFTSFIITYLPGLSFMGVDLVKRLLRLPLTFDQQFRAQKQIQELRLTLGIRSHAHSLRSTKARTAHGKVLQSVNRFWVKLTEPSVNVKEVSELADDISSRRRAAVAHFDLALRRQQTADPVLLRRLGDFFGEILMAPDAAQECYEESRDIIEARQARSMRGTRAHTAVADVIALTERQRNVLVIHSKSNSSHHAASTASSRLMKYFSAAVTALFLVLVVCSVLFIVVASNLTKDVQDLLDGTLAVTTARIAASRFGSTMIGCMLTREETTLSMMKGVLVEMSDIFASSLEFLTTGSGRPHSEAGEFLMAEDTIPFYSSLIENPYGFSLRALSESFLQATNRFIDDMAHTLPTGYSDSAQFIMSATMPLYNAYSELLTLQTTTEMDTLSLKWIIWLFLVYIFALISLALSYAALVLAFRRTAITRVLTFQLFTLIPYEALERLATEAKERFHHIAVEKSFRQGRENAKERNVGDKSENNTNANTTAKSTPENAVTDPTAGTTGAGAAGSPPGEQTKWDSGAVGSDSAGLHPRAGAAGKEAAFVPLKSCLKVSNRSPGKSEQLSPTLLAARASREKEKDQEKRVRFNPVVEVVGSAAADGAGKDGRDAAAKRSGENEEAGEDIDLLLMANGNARSRTSKRSESKKVGNSRNALHGTLLYFTIIFGCVATSMVMLGLTLQGPLKYMNGLENYRNLQQSFNDIFLHITYVQTHTLSFISTGSVHEFQFAQNYVSMMVQEIPRITGSNVPLSVTPSLTQMHRTALFMGNLSIDVSVLAAKAYAVSLDYWSDARLRNDLPESELVALMRTKYSTSMNRMDNIFASVGTLPDDQLILYAFAIWYDNANPNSDYYRHLYYRIMQEASDNDIADAHFSRAMMVTTIVLTAVAIGVSLLVAVSPFRNVIDVYVPRRHMVLTALAFMPVMGLSIAVLSMHSERSLTSTGLYDNTLSGLDGAFEAMVSYNGHMSYFVHSVVSSWFFAATAVPTTAARNALSDVIISEYGDDEAVSSLFTRLTATWSRMNQYSNISAALIINIFKTFTTMEEPMLDALEASHWDFSIESDYYTRSAMYTMSNAEEQNDVPYRTKESDLALSRSAQHLVAIGTIMSGSYARCFTMSVEYMRELYSRFITGSYNRQSKETKKRVAVLIAALVLCVLPLLACVIMAKSVLTAVRFVFQVTGLSATNGARMASTASSSESARYVSMLSRARYSLFLVALLFTATFCIAIWLTQTGYAFTSIMADTTDRQSLVSSSFFYARQLVTTHTTFVTPKLIYAEVAELTNHVASLAMGESNVGVPVGLFLSDKINTFTYGPIDMQEDLKVALSYMRDNCSRLIEADGPLPLGADMDYGGGLKIPLVQSMSDWVVYVSRTAALMEDMTGNALAQIPAQIDQLNVVAVSLLPALQLANKDVTVAVSHFNNVASTALLVLAVLTLVCTLAVYLVVVVPTLVRLFREEESLQMLLHMIPPAVRDEVPAISQFMETGQVTNMAALQKKFDANEKLLQNILPQKIAARLKSGEQPIADTHDSVTMLFTDFVGFTKRSTTMQAREIVDFLNEVFLEFDTVVELLNLEKIKTIGDAYFMAGGLEPLITDHALRVVEAGIKFFEALEEHNRRHPSREPLRMRLGVHTGPVVAGVIGTKKVAYDLWGESVEIANALESTGVPGYVHISEETAKYVRGFFRLEPRGELPREKEHIPENMPKTYLVVGRELPTPYMHLRRPRLLATVFHEKDKEKEKAGKEKDHRSGSSRS